MPERPRRLRDDEWLNHLHRATTRNDPEELRVLAIDHRWQLEEVADELGVGRENLRELKGLLGRAFRRVAEEEEAAGVLLDDVYGDKALEELTGSRLWIARAVEVAGSRPVEFVGGPNVAATLRTWPQEHVVKCNLYWHPEDEPEIRDLQEQRVFQLFDACVNNDRQLLLEVQAPQGMPYDEGSMAQLLARFYEIGVRPDCGSCRRTLTPACGRGSGTWSASTTRTARVCWSSGRRLGRRSSPRASPRRPRSPVQRVRDRALHLRRPGAPLAGRRDR